MRADLLLVLLGGLLLGGCGREEARWDGYAMRDRPSDDGTRLVGSYNTLDSCRAGLLAADSDASSEALVCTQGCPPATRGLLEQCAATRVIRPVRPDLRDALTLPAAAPAGAADRSPDSDPSRP